jgi:hypothetical protein
MNFRKRQSTSPTAAQTRQQGLAARLEIELELYGAGHPFNEEGK